MSVWDVVYGFLANNGLAGPIIGFLFWAGPLALYTRYEHRKSRAHHQALHDEMLSAMRRPPEVS
jgi:hypothetical protein